MAYTPENNPYIPGDPYSYDLKWMVNDIKHMEERFGTLDQRVQDATDQADRSEHEADRSRDEADRSNDEALVSEGYANGEQDGIPVTDPDSPYYENNAKYYADDAQLRGNAEVLKAEGHATGTQNGTPVGSGSPYYENNSKYYSEQSADSAQAAADYAAHIADPVSGLVAEWLSTHVDPDSGYVIDDTFTIQGAAADAQATGDALRVAASLKYNSFTTAIPANDDYNDYLTEGCYVVATAAIAASLANRPTSTAGRLFVMTPASANHVVQIYIDITGNFFKRVYNSADQTFTVWGDPITTRLTNLESVIISSKYGYFTTAMTSGQDFDSFLTEGSYRVESGTIANTLLNKPINQAGRLIVISMASNNHKMQIYIAVNGKIYHRLYSSAGGGTFSDWICEYNNIEAIESAIISAKYDILVGTVSSSDNFNDYLTEGSFKVTSAAIAATVSNIPVVQAGRLIVISMASNNHKMQIYIAVNGKIYHRLYSSAGGTFSDWICEYNNIEAIESAIISAKYDILVGTVSSSDNFNDYLTEGSYKVTSAAIAATVSNIPVVQAGRLIVMSMATNNHKMQIYIAVNGNIYHRLYSSADGGTWYDWIGENHYTSLLNGKKWVSCGDSFTAGDFTGDPGEVRFQDQPYQGQYKVYPFFVGRRTGADIVNEAISGSCMAYVDGTHNEFSTPGGRYTQIPADADYITLYFGINDSHQNVPIGTINDAVNTTFYGAWNIVMQYLIANHPKAKIGIVISNGCDSVDYPNAEKAIAKKYGVSVLDINSDYNVPILFRVNGKPDVDAFVLADALATWRVSISNEHPNVDCHEYESSIFENWLLSM